MGPSDLCSLCTLLMLPRTRPGLSWSSKRQLSEEQASSPVEFTARDLSSWRITLCKSSILPHFAQVRRVVLPSPTTNKAMTMTMTMTHLKKSVQQPLGVALQALIWLLLSVKFSFSYSTSLRNPLISCSPLFPFINHLSLGDVAIISANLHFIFCETYSSIESSHFTSFPWHRLCFFLCSRSNLLLQPL